MQAGAYLLKMSPKQLVDTICRDAEARNTCLRRLILHRDAGRFLEKLLRNRNPEIKIATVRLISKTHAQVLREQLISSVSDKDSRVRSETIKCLSRNNVANTREVLTAAVSDNDRRVRISALQALGRSGDKSATRSVANCLTDAHQSVRLAAAEALMNLPGKPAIPMLAKALGDRSAAVRMRVIRVVGKHRYKSLADKIAASCYDDDSMTQESAIRVLGELGVDKTVPALLDVIANVNDPALQIRAIEALANFRDRDTAACLISRLSDPDVDLRCAAADALAIRKERRAVRYLKDTIATENDASARRHMHICLASLQQKKTAASDAAEDPLLGSWYSSPGMDAGSLIYTFNPNGTGEFEDFMMGVTRDRIDFKYFKNAGCLEFLKFGKKRKMKTRFTISHTEFYQQAAGSFPCLKLVFDREPFFQGLKPGKSTYYRVLR